MKSFWWRWTLPQRQPWQKQRKRPNQRNPNRDNMKFENTTMEKRETLQRQPLNLNKSGKWRDEGSRRRRPITWVHFQDVYWADDGSPCETEKEESTSLNLVWTWATHLLEGIEGNKLAEQLINIRKHSVKQTEATLFSDFWPHLQIVSGTIPCTTRLDGWWLQLVYEGTPTMRWNPSGA